MGTARRASELAARQLDAEQRKFTIGTASNFQVIEFQRQLSQARTQELRAVIDLNIARAGFERAQGTLLESLGLK